MQTRAVFGRNGHPIGDFSVRHVCSRHGVFIGQLHCGSFSPLCSVAKRCGLASGCIGQGVLHHNIKHFLIGIVCGRDAVTHGIVFTIVASVRRRTCEHLRDVKRTVMDADRNGYPVCGRAVHHHGVCIAEVCSRLVHDLARKRIIEGSRIAVDIRFHLAGLQLGCSG